ARGAVALATGEDDPVRPLRRSVSLWRDAGSPYESARARVLLADALDRADQHEEARLELAHAHVCFGRLGARLDAEAAAESAPTGRVLAGRHEPDHQGRSLIAQGHGS
ncbi:MAG: hypothetical protein M3291_11245, partial [Actinomycetota bacterium]|nr:hypothetical protein [Actinomycetota bacterium]